LSHADNRADFERHWASHRGDAVSAAKAEEARGFLRPLFDHLRRSPSRIRVLDVGCGDGVHAAVFAENGFPHRYCGVDLSHGALVTARRHAERGASFQAGDVLRLPYRTASFEAVFAYGVLAYTTAPQQALDEMIRVCTPGGLIGVWVYPKPSGIAGVLYRTARALCRTSPIAAKVLVFLIVPLLPVLPVRSGVNLFTSTWRQCVEIVEVNLVPTVLDFFSQEQVLDWLRDRGLAVQYVDPERPIAVWART